MGPLEIGLGHRGGDHHHRAVLGVIDRQLGIVRLEADDPAQTNVIEDLLDSGDEVAQLKVAVASKLVEARLLEFCGLEPDSGLH